MFYFVFSCNGQSGAATRGNTGEIWENKVYYTHRSQHTTQAHVGKPRVMSRQKAGVRGKPGLDLSGGFLAKARQVKVNS